VPLGTHQVATGNVAAGNEPGDRRADVVGRAHPAHPPRRFRQFRRHMNVKVDEERRLVQRVVVAVEVGVHQQPRLLGPPLPHPTEHPTPANAEVGPRAHGVGRQRGLEVAANGRRHLLSAANRAIRTIEPGPSGTAHPRRINRVRARQNERDIGTISGHVSSLAHAGR